MQSYPLSMKTPRFLLETIFFWWRQHKFIGDTQIFIGDPNIFKGTPYFAGDPQIFIADPKKFIEYPQIFIIDYEIFIWDSQNFIFFYLGVSYKILKVSNENLGVSNEHLRFSNVKYGASNKIIWPPIKSLGSPIKIWGLQWTSEVSDENIGSPMKIWESKHEYWGLQRDVHGGFQWEGASNSTPMLRIKFPWGVILQILQYYYWYVFINTSWECSPGRFIINLIISPVSQEWD